MTERSMMGAILWPASALVPSLARNVLSRGPFDSPGLGVRLKERHVPDEVAGIMREVTADTLPELNAARLLKTVVRDVLDTEQAPEPLVVGCLEQTGRIMEDHGLPKERVEELLSSGVVQAVMVQTVSPGPQVTLT